MRRIGRKGGTGGEGEDKGRGEREKGRDRGGEGEGIGRGEREKGRERGGSGRGEREKARETAAGGEGEEKRERGLGVFGCEKVRGREVCLFRLTLFPLLCQVSIVY